MPHPKLTEVFNRAIDQLDIQPGYYEYRHGKISPETKERSVMIMTSEERPRMLDEIRKTGGEIFAVTFTPDASNRLLRIALKEDEIWATNTYLASVRQLVFTLRLPRATVPPYAEHRDFEEPDAMVEEILAYLGRR